VAKLGVGIAALALALRVGHVLTVAKLLVADDAVFFERHATAFVEAWRAIGRPEFGALLREALDHASLQGIVYPVFLSLIYGLRGAIDHVAVGLAQAALGAFTVWLVFLATRRAFGDSAAVAAGTIAAVYPPLVLTAGLLLAEGVLLFLQSLAAYLLVRALDLDRWRSRTGAGVIVGSLMLRPAFQHAGILAAIGLLLACGVPDSGGHRRVQRLMKFVAPYLAGVLVIAAPWMLTNGVVFERFVWSRTGDAWQQVYWGIYPPNRGWWPPDSPVPPKYGVESLPGARASGMRVETRDLDYLEAAIDQIRATPLQALATEVNKVVHGYLYPFNPYAESPSLLAPFAAPLHRIIIWLTLVGVALSWRRPAPSLVLGGVTFAISMPFVVSHIDLRYVLPIALAALPFAGHAVAEVAGRIRGPRQLRLAVAPVAAVGALVIASRIHVPVLLWAMPSLEALSAHRVHTATVVLALIAAGGVLGAWFGGTARPVIIAASFVVGGVCAIQAFYDPSWHEWSSLVRPGETAIQRITLPVDWAPPAGTRAEVRLYAQGASAQTYVPVLHANGRELARLGTAFTEGGPLRFEERIMVAASRQGKARADVPQWYGVPLDVGALTGGSVELSLSVDGPPDTWVRLWGDYPPAPGQRVIEAPAVHSRIQGQDDSFQKFVATGHSRLWRRFPLASVATAASRQLPAGGWLDDLSDQIGRQRGEFRLRVLIFTASGELLAIF